MTRPTSAAVAAGVLGAEERHRELLQSIVEVARAIFGAKASSIFLLDEDAGRARLRGRRGRGRRRRCVGSAFPSSTGLAGWVLVDAPAARRSRTLEHRPALRARRGRGDRLRPEGPDGGAAAARASARSACSRCSTGPSGSRSRSRRWSCSACSRTQAAIALDLLQRARRAQAAPGRERRRGRRRSPGSPSGSRLATATRAPRGCACSRRSKRSCALMCPGHAARLQRERRRVRRPHSRPSALRRGRRPSARTTALSTSAESVRRCAPDRSARRRASAPSTSGSATRSASESPSAASCRSRGACDPRPPGRRPAPRAFP